MPKKDARPLAALGRSAPLRLELLLERDRERERFFLWERERELWRRCPDGRERPPETTETPSPKGSRKPMVRVGGV